jgi:D-alanyl-D-alanine carboxypeptidase
VIARLCALLGALAVVLAGLVPAAVAQEAQPDVTANGAVLWDPADDVVLYAHNAEEPRRMASTTKVMTTLLALESGGIDEELVVSEHAVEVGRTPGAARLGLYAGQRIAVRHVLAGLVLRSGNDGAVAVAEHLAGSEHAFVDKMNARAQELGLTGTAFLDSSGLTGDAGHHSSPLDLARLSVAAMAYPDFMQWAGADRMDVPQLGMLENRNELVGAYAGATGVKTGYTGLAGLCLIASATREGRTLYAVVLDSDNSFSDAAELLDYGFSAYVHHEPIAEGQQAATYRWSGGEVPLISTEPLGQTVRTGTDVRWRTVLDPVPPLPIRAGDQLGRAELLVEGVIVESVPLSAAEPSGLPPPASPAADVGAAVEDAVRAFSRLHTIDRAA